MKDITDYFGSPTVNLNKTVEENDARLEIQERKEDSITCVKEDIKVISMIENPSSDTVKSVKHKKPKKNKKRKPPDPAVTNLHSNDVNVISPNASFSAVVESDQESRDKIDTNSVGSDIGTHTFCTKKDQNAFDQNNSSDAENRNKQDTSKVNVFQFMMGSRNKSIGQNSQGKVVSENEDDTEDKLSKEKFSSRRNILENWAEKKGAAKRKREEEEKDEVINYKLHKRSKRLKKLLRIKTIRDNDDSNDIIMKNKRIKRISTTSESSIEILEMVDISKEVQQNPVLEIIEENAQNVFNSDKIKDTNPSLLNFFGVITNTNKKENIGLDKLHTKAKKKKKLKRNLEKDTESKESKEVVILRKSIGGKPVPEPKCDTMKRKNFVKSTQEFKSETPKNKVFNDSENSLKQNSLKSWKMRIRMNLEDGPIVKNGTREQRTIKTRRKNSVMEAHVISDESSSEGKINVVHSKCIKQKKMSEEEFVSSSESDSDFKPKRAVKKSSKLAPIFVKATPKPKLDPKVLEARKQFLRSGIPYSLQKTIEKQQRIEEREYEIFPIISHIQQKCKASLWTLPSTELNLQEYSPLTPTEPKICSGITNSHIIGIVNTKTEVEKVDKLKTLLNKIKADNPAYPVYKTFRLVYEKSGLTPHEKEDKKPTPKRKKNRKRHSKEPEKPTDIIKPECDSEFAMWTDKYKPKCSDDIVGNSKAVKQLKKWLEAWMNFSKEINTKKKRRREASTSESEFDTTDCDSRDSTKLPGNTVVLGGPCGSGKSAAVYAICNELGFHVIELNASSKRTGKLLLQKLQEATQSHQVRKNEQTCATLYRAQGKTELKEPETKMCVLLIEDVDIVFEQDDGFISALAHLVASSKRPIVMTTTDSNSVSVQKFVSQYEYVLFLPLSRQILATWLQIVCLAEGLFINQGDIGSLLEYNRGDVRKTLLELQFWVKSGGEITRSDVPIKIKNDHAIAEGESVDDEQPLHWVKDNSKIGDVVIHSNCISSFVIFRDHNPYIIPYFVNLGLIWWNMPSILNIPDYSQNRIDKFKDNPSSNEIKAERSTWAQSDADRKKIIAVAQLYDSLSITDVLFRKVGYYDGSEPVVKNYNSDIKDSLELSECTGACTGYLDFSHDVTHCLVNGYVEQYNGIEKGEITLNMAVPERAERRWRAKHHVCEDVFQEALPLSNYIERRSVALDYMPTLRNISRSETRRAANNTKRGNRFRNYLRDLGINYSAHTLQLACNILTTNDSDK